jgi:xylulokinase
VANLLVGAEALGHGDGRVLLIGGGANSAAYRQVVADLTGRPVVVPREDELVACGAALQAATVLLGGDVDDRAEAWGLGTGATIEPDPRVDGAAIRAAYAAEANREDHR